MGSNAILDGRQNEKTGDIVNLTLLPGLGRPGAGRCLLVTPT